MNETLGSLELNCLRKPMKQCCREYVHPRNPQKAKFLSLQRGIHSRGSGVPQNEVHDELTLGKDVTNCMEKYTRPHSVSTVRRRHSLSHLPSYNAELCSPIQLQAERDWSDLRLDLWVSLPASMQRKDGLENFPREASCAPGGLSKEPRQRNLELELSMMQFELLSLKQKMQSSFAHLEKEKMWLEMARCEDRKQNGNLDNKIFHVETKLAKTKSYLGSRNPDTAFLDSNQNAKEKKDVDQKLVTLQESSIALQKCLKALEKERDEMALKLKSAEEEQKITFCQIAKANLRATTSLQANHELEKEIGRLQSAYNSITLEKNQLSAKVISLKQKVNELTLKLRPALSDREQLLQEKGTLHQHIQKLTLELACAQEKWEMFSDQTLALHSELVDVKTQNNHKEKEKVVMKEELESTKQVNQELSSEVTESCPRLGASLEKLHHLEAENKILNDGIQALENECDQLWGEMEGRPPERQLSGRSQQEDMAAVQGSCECLGKSQSLLQSEKISLQTRCLELEAALQQKQEEMVNQLMQQQQVETPLFLQIQLDAYKQELELERNSSQALHHQIQILQSRGQNNATLTNEASLEEVDPELALVREELQKVWDILKTRDTELEEQRLELESARSQYTKCSSEKQKLEQLVTSLEEEIAEKEQALRNLRQAKDMDRTELEVKISSLEKKVAAMEASQGLPSTKPNHALQILEGQKNGSFPSKDSRSWGACSHCSTALLQLNQLIQSYAEKSSRKQEEEATLTYLYHVQDLLKGKARDQNLVSIPDQRQTEKPDAKIHKTLQKDQESLRQRQQLVTEQLKGLFRQRKQLKEGEWKKQFRVPKAEGLVEIPKSQEALATPESNGLTKEGHPEALAAPGNGGEVQRLQQQLKEKTETINSMASEIQALQEKNESLMKAKLRFRQQIQEIRKLPKQWPEKGNTSLLVPKPGLGQDLQNAQWSDGSAPSPQSDDTTFFSHSQEDLHLVTQGPPDPPTAKGKQSVLSSDKGAVCRPLTGSAGQEASFSALLLPSQADFSESAVPAIKLSFETPLKDPQGQIDTEGALVSASASALLSPRPFGSQRPWSPFKFKGTSESLEK